MTRTMLTLFMAMTFFKSPAQQVTDVHSHIITPEYVSFLQLHDLSPLDSEAVDALFKRLSPTKD